MNPILSGKQLPDFDQIRPEHMWPAVEQALSKAEEMLEAISQDQTVACYDNTLGALEELYEIINRPTYTVMLLRGVQDSPELREAMNKILPAITSFQSKLTFHEGLWRRLKTFAASHEAKTLEGLQRRHLEKTMRSFQRNGADLAPEQKEKLAEIRLKLSNLSKEFSEHTLDSTNAFELVITDETDLAGLPERAVNMAKASAESKDKEGWRFTLQVPSYIPFMRYADNRTLRETMYHAFMGIANEGDFDNKPLIYDIIKHRRELAEILGYQSFADYQVEERMVQKGEAIREFLNDLYDRTQPYFEVEKTDLIDFAKGLGYDQLKAWDVAYVSEKMRQQYYDYDEERLRPYFPLNNVLKGLFEITARVFGVTVKRADNQHVWHPDVEFYELADIDGSHIGSFYADWFPREEKRSGAWLMPLFTGGKTAQGFEPNVGMIAANFTLPEGDQPALLSHREVETVFHEFGHLLHHCLGKVPIKSLGGTSVAWDFVELPSQIMENWCWEKEALDLFGKHYQSGETIPAELFAKMEKARTFLGANLQMRQISLGTTDFKLHVDFELTDDLLAYVANINEDFMIYPEFAHNSFVTSFSHIFAGGYATGYYSYKWAEVLDADAFSRFKKEGIFNRQTGRDFVDCILSKGDSAEPMELFRAFMGRDPDSEALIQRNLGNPPIPA